MKFPSIDWAIAAAGGCDPVEVRSQRGREFGRNRVYFRRRFLQRQVEFFEERGPARVGVERVESWEADYGGEFVIAIG